MSELENLRLRLRHRDEENSRLRGRIEALERANEVLIETLAKERSRSYLVERIAADDRRALTSLSEREYS